MYALKALAFALSIVSQEMLELRNKELHILQNAMHTENLSVASNLLRTNPSVFELLSNTERDLLTQYIIEHEIKSAFDVLPQNTRNELLDTYFENHLDDINVDTLITMGLFFNWNPNKKDKNGIPAYFKIVLTNLQDITTPLKHLDGTINLNTPYADQQGNQSTLLHYTLQHSTPMHIKQLLQLGANPNIPVGPDENTFLHELITNKEMDYVSNIIEDKARISSKFNLEATNIYGNTPLLHAASLGKLTIVSYLIMHGANATAKNLDQQGPLHLLAQRNSNDLMEEDVEVEIIDQLIKSGASLDKDIFGKTPMDYAKEKNNNYVKYLDKAFELQRNKIREAEEKLKNEQELIERKKKAAEEKLKKFIEDVKKETITYCLNKKTQEMLDCDDREEDVEYEEKILPKYKELPFPLNVSKKFGKVRSSDHSKIYQAEHNSTKIYKEFVNLETLDTFTQDTLLNLIHEAKKENKTFRLAVAITKNKDDNTTQHNYYDAKLLNTSIVQPDLIGQDREGNLHYDRTKGDRKKKNDPNTGKPLEFPVYYFTIKSLDNEFVYDGEEKKQN